MQQHRLSIPPSLALQQAVSPPLPQQASQPTRIANNASTQSSVQTLTGQHDNQRTSPQLDAGTGNGQECSRKPNSSAQRQQLYGGNGYTKQSTADVIRARLNISSKKKGANGHSFSHSDEMTYKRTTALKDFVILQKLGDGAYSSVYKVKRIEDGQIYALKKVKIGTQTIKDKENAINEVRILANIAHPNVVQYREAFIDNESQTLNLVMQLADGGDLLKMISDRKKRKVHFRESQVWRVLIETVYGLRAMHELSVMHRDIKSANIFLFKNQRREVGDGGNLYQSKLGDMNVSKVTNQNGLNYTQTGTPYYASPEVWKDEPYGYKSDVWSLGCVIYEMLSLKPPFTGRDMDQLFKRVCKGIFPRIPDHYSNDIWAIVQLMLRVDPSKRPDCTQLINSKMFQVYTEKLNTLDSVDQTFQETLKSSSPDRAQLTQITSSLLTQIHMPFNDISSLTSFLPNRNYESAATIQGRKAGGSLLKTSSVKMKETRDMSNTSRKLETIRNAHQVARQRTQLQHTEEINNNSATEQSQQLQLESARTPRMDNQTNGKRQIKGTISPKMTKIQSKLQRQYLNQKEITSNASQSIDQHLNTIENRSNNPTVITNRSGSKQSMLTKPVEQLSSEKASEREHSLRKRLSNKRKHVYGKDEATLETQIEEAYDQNPQPKLAVNRNKTTGKKRKEVESPSKLISLQEEGGLSQNVSPGKIIESTDNSYMSDVVKMSTLTKGRLSLPVVATQRVDQRQIQPPSTLNQSQEYLEHEINSGSGAASPIKATQMQSLPMLSEIESETISLEHQNTRAVEPNILSNKYAASRPFVQGMNSGRGGVQRIQNNPPQGSKRQLPIDSEGDNEYTSGGKRGGIGKRHASFDMLTPNSMSNQYPVPGGNNVASLMASQGILQQPNEMSILTNKLPDSQSQSQINMINKQGLIARHHGSTSSSEDKQIRATIINTQASEAVLKQHIRKRYDQRGHKSGKNESLRNKQIVSQNELQLFNMNQQQSVRHQQSDANFSLNSEDLRNAGFQHRYEGHQMQISSARNLVESNKNVKLPQIEMRKQSYELSDRKIINKLQHPQLKQNLISKKKPSLNQQQQHYSSAGNQQPLHGGSLTSSAHLANKLHALSINQHHQSLKGQNQSPKAVGATTLKSNSLIATMPHSVIKKKTLAAYANSRARNNNRQNLIYTQKQSI